MAYYSKNRRNGIDSTYIAAGVIIFLGIVAIIVALNIFKAQDEKAAQGMEEQPTYTEATTFPEYEYDLSDDPSPEPSDEQPDTPLPSEPDEEPDETEVPQELTTAATKPSEDEQPVMTTSETSEKTKEAAETTASTTKKKDDAKFDSSLKDAKATKSALKSMMKSSDYSLFSETFSSGSCVSAELDKASSMSKFQYLVQGECECILLCGNDGSVAAAVCDYGEIRYYANTAALKKSVPSCIKDYFSLAYPGVSIKKCN